MNPRRNPVLLIHGIKDDARKMEPMARHLRELGWEAHAFSYGPTWGERPIEALAALVSAEVQRLFPNGQKFDLVAFSMGGLVMRYFLQRMDGLARVERFITISTPHRGTWLAYLLHHPGCRQMRPGSAFLQDLASDADRLKELRFISLWTRMALR